MLKKSIEKQDSLTKRLIVSANQTKKEMRQQQSSSIYGSPENPYMLATGKDQLRDIKEQELSSPHSRSKALEST